MNILRRSILVICVVSLLVGVNCFSVSSEVFANNDDIDEEINTLIDQARIPSVSACIIKNDSIVWYGGYGKYNKLLRLKPTKNTVYMAASVSKAITATAVMQLYEKGLFDLDDDVSEYLPFVLRNPKYPDIPITFRMLLSHQSSLSLSTQFLHIGIAYMLNFLKSPYPNFEEFFVPGGRAYSPTTWNDNKPGEAFNYSNFGYNLLEYLVGSISKQPFKEYCRENIFIPLEMYNSSFSPRDFKRINLAVPYVQIGKFIIRGPFYDAPVGQDGYS